MKRGVRSFSSQNVLHMHPFFNAYQSEPKLSTPLRELPAQLPGKRLLQGQAARDLCRTGTRDMITRCREAGLPEPQFALTDGFVTIVRPWPERGLETVTPPVIPPVAPPVAALLRFLGDHGALGNAEIREQMNLKPRTHRAGASHRTRPRRGDYRAQRPRQTHEPTPEIPPHRQAPRAPGLDPAEGRRIIAYLNTYLAMKDSVVPLLIAVLPHAADAWFSFTRYFYKPQPLRSLEEIRADILKLEKETEGLLGEIVGGLPR